MAGCRRGLHLSLGSSIERHLYRRAVVTPSVRFGAFDSVKFQTEMPKRKIKAGMQGVIVERLDSENFLIEVCGADLLLVPVHVSNSAS